MVGENNHESGGSCSGASTVMAGYLDRHLETGINKPYKVLLGTYLRYVGRYLMY